MKVRASVVLLVLSMTFALLPSSASADGIYASGSQGDGSFSGAHVLGVTVVEGNQVGLWQAMLYADGYGLYDCFPADPSFQVDGYWGPYTSRATGFWQEDWMNGYNSGVTDSQTWGRADDWVTPNGPDGYFHYWGSNVTLDLWRYIPGGPYWFWWSDAAYSNWNVTDHPDNAMTPCHPASG